MPPGPPTAFGTSALPSPGPRPSSPAGSGRRGRSSAPNAPAGPRRTRRSRRPTGPAWSPGSPWPTRTRPAVGRAAAVRVVTAEEAGPEPDIREIESPGPSIAFSIAGRSSPIGATANVFPPSTELGERGGPEQRRDDLDRPGPREQHLDLAEAVLGQPHAAPDRARPLAARHLAVLEHAGAAGRLGEPGDVGRAGGVDRHAGVVAPAQEPRRRGRGRSARQAHQHRRRGDLRSPMGEGYASGWRDGAGSLS